MWPIRGRWSIPETVLIPSVTPSSPQDALIICGADSFMSVFGGIAVFSTLGYLSKQLNVPIDQVVQSGNTIVVLLQYLTISHIKHHVEQWCTVPLHYCTQYTSNNQSTVSLQYPSSTQESISHSLPIPRRSLECGLPVYGRCSSSSCYSSSDWAPCSVRFIEIFPCPVRSNAPLSSLTIYAPTRSIAIWESSHNFFSC